MCFEDAVVQYFESKGFKCSRAHVYPNDPIIIECPEPIPEPTYGDR